MVKDYTFALMQGRLLPRFKNRYQAFPLGYWESEFYMAKKLGFDFIEWIVDFNDVQKNPLMSTTDLKHMTAVCNDSNVNIRSVCADYFMEAPLHGPDAMNSQHTLNQLIKNCHQLNIQDIIIPCVDQSSLITESDIQRFIKNITPSLALAEELNILINLETDLAPIPFLKLIQSIHSPCIKVNYDTGNSASLGYNINEEFETYGEYISVLHIKDRPFGKGSVYLGTGDTDFDIIPQLLNDYPIIKKVTLQAFRHEDYLADINGVKHQLEFLKSTLKGVLV
jgi:L-ribulose-5-phosphate 3-epimerase